MSMLINVCICICLSMLPAYILHSWQEAVTFLNFTSRAYFSLLVCIQRLPVLNCIGGKLVVPNSMNLYLYL